MRVLTLREALEAFVERRCGVVEEHPTFEVLVRMVDNLRPAERIRIDWSYREHLVCCPACGDTVLELEALRKRWMDQIQIKPRLQRPSVPT